MDTDNIPNEVYISIITGHAIAMNFFMITGVLTWGVFNKKIILYKLDKYLNSIGVTYDDRCVTVFIAIVLGFIRITLHGI
jgi:heme/copper-type cytochrome/quinol oxidase subunit 1